MVTLAVPAVGDAKAIHALVGSCPPLDLNSTYAYLLLCAHFAETCVIDTSTCCLDKDELCEDDSECCGNNCDTLVTNSCVGL